MGSENPEFYISSNGARRRWRYPDTERPNWKDGEPVSPAGCYDCELPYSNFVDVVIPHELWERINPTEHQGAGLLCPNCIFERLQHIGISEVLAT